MGEHEERPASRLSFGDPFATPAEERRPDRRLRGRLLSPVTVWTAGRGEERAGLTVSSLVVVEGEPAAVLAVLDPLSRLHEVSTATGRALVHVLAPGDEHLARLFAGLYPTDPFDEVTVTDTGHGPRLEGVGTLAALSEISSRPAGYQAVVHGRVDSIELASHPRPLGWYRGNFAPLG